MIFYPYNENLPIERAHDVYLLHNCASLAEAGHPVTLGIGKDSIEDELLRLHYRIGDALNIERLSTWRSSPWLKWNRPFFRAARAWIAKHKPDLVITSTFKLAEYLHLRRTPDTSYVFELHELEGGDVTEREREMLARSDLIVTTTRALERQLRDPPYSLATPVEVVPLAVHATPLAPPKGPSTPLQVAYVGQVYPLQGVDLLLDALRYDSHTHLTIVGGPEPDASRLRDYAKAIGVDSQTTITGFRRPAELHALLANIDAFAMPARKILTCPHIAHTKLLEYATWGRPIIAPDSPIVTEHLTAERGIVTYNPSDPRSIAAAFTTLRSNYDTLATEIRTLSNQFTWSSRAKRYSTILERFLPGVSPPGPHQGMHALDPHV